MEHENEIYVYIEGPNVHQCTFCGAYANSIELIEHHRTCTRAQGAAQYEGMFNDVDE